jgi:molecular chaperone GrpE (heat shock protein)
MLISESEVYKREVEKIQKFLNESQSENQKDQVKILFKDLVSSVKKLDSAHQDIGGVKRLADDINDFRNHVTTIRKKIFSIIDKN